VDIIIGETYTHKNGNDYIVLAKDKCMLSGVSTGMLVKYKPVDAIKNSDFYIKTEKHFRSGFTKKDPQ